MPAVTPQDKVVVTGANGFLAAWLVQELLDNGYSVRGTVRSLEKGEYVLSLFRDAVESKRFELFEVPDFLAEGAFDQAVKDVDAIVHTATPVHLGADDPDGERWRFSDKCKPDGATCLQRLSNLHWKVQSLSLDPL